MNSVNDNTVAMPTPTPAPSEEVSVFTLNNFLELWLAQSGPAKEVV